MKKLLVLFMLIFSPFSYSQNTTIDKNGNFVSTSNTAKSDTIDTGKTFTDSKGNIYPVFKTARGKLYYPRISKSGKYYRAYLKIESEEPSKN